MLKYLTSCNFLPGIKWRIVILLHDDSNGVARRCTCDSSDIWIN